MKRKLWVIGVVIIVVAMVLNDILTALELEWYIKLLPFMVILLGYISVTVYDKFSKK